MIASAPGKIILFGEHAVVYGRHAIVSAINLRCRVKVERSSSFVIRSPLGTTGLDFTIHPYISYTVRRFQKLESIEGAEITVSSDIPIGSGLGSSAAVIVATLKALCGEFGVELERDEIFELAKQVEIDVQGRASGIDPFISTFGGAWLFPERREVRVPFKFFVINLGEKSTAEMVSKVAKLRERHGETVNRIFDVIDSIAMSAVEKIGDEEFIEELIVMNQSMLRAIGVSTPQIDELIARLEEEGFRVKITGAGGGGCIFGLYRGRAPAESVILESEREGVRFES